MRAARPFGNGAPFYHHIFCWLHTKGSYLSDPGCFVPPSIHPVYRPYLLIYCVDPSRSDENGASCVFHSCRVRKAKEMSMPTRTHRAPYTIAPISRRLVCESNELWRVKSHCDRQAIFGNKEAYMFIVLFAVLLLAWLGGFLVFHLSSALIHVLLLFAVISLIVHIFQHKTVS